MAESDLNLTQQNLNGVACTNEKTFPEVRTAADLVELIEHVCHSFRTNGRSICPDFESIRLVHSFKLLDEMLPWAWNVKVYSRRRTKQPVYVMNGIG